MGDIVPSLENYFNGMTITYNTVPHELHIEDSKGPFKQCARN